MSKNLVFDEGVFYGLVDCEDELGLFDTVPELLDYVIEFSEENKVPDIVEFFEYRRETLDKGEIMSLYLFMDEIHEMYGNPDTVYEPTEGIKKAWNSLIDTIINEYDVWACKKSGPVQKVLTKPYMESGEVVEVVWLSNK